MDRVVSDPALTALVDELEAALIDLDRVRAREVLGGSHPRWSPAQRIETVLVPTLERIGLAWERGRVALSQVYMSGRICEELVDALLAAPNPAGAEHPPVAIAVLEDYHFLGKRIVYAMLRAGGIPVVDYGRQDVDGLVQRVTDDRVGILLVSVLLLPSALKVRDLRARLNTVGLDTRIVVGGAPFRFDPDLWREVGADAMGRNGADAIAIVQDLIRELQ